MDSSAAIFSCQGTRQVKRYRAKICLLIVDADALQMGEDAINVCTPSAEMEVYNRKSVTKDQWQTISASDQWRLENGDSITVAGDGTNIYQKKWSRVEKSARQQQSVPIRAHGE